MKIKKMNLTCNKLSLALALSLGISQAVQAQFSNPLQLSDLNGDNGFVIHGENASDNSGRSVSSAGDINGDGIDDLIIGASSANPNGNLRAGSSYVVFGSTSGLPNPFNLIDINGSNGFVIHGEDVNNFSGRSVSSAGDVNGDGIDDLVIGAFTTDLNGNAGAGSSFVVFGSTSALPNPFNLTGINGSNGFVIRGETFFDTFGRPVSSAGDINGDGIDDLIIGAERANPNGNLRAGSSYVIFGSASGLPSPLNLTGINGSNGFVIHGENVEDRSGGSVSSAGDVNGDGIDDLIIGAHYADPNSNSYAGSSYVVFGSTSGLPNPFNLTSLNGSNGFVIHGESATDFSGRSVSSAGDVNGDGIDDLIIGAPRTNSNGEINSGSSYVIFGSTSDLPNPFNLTSITGSNGFVIQGGNANDYSGRSVSSAGDVNGDGIDDLLIGAYRADPNSNSNAGSSYVVFGSTFGLPSQVNLTDLNGLNGFVIHGENANDRSGWSVSSAGDVNGDGVDDVIIGASNINSSAGSSYVVFGQEKPIFKDSFED